MKIKEEDMYEDRPLLIYSLIKDDKSGGTEIRKDAAKICRKGGN